MIIENLEISFVNFENMFSTVEMITGASKKKMKNTKNVCRVSNNGLNDLDYIICTARWGVCNHTKL